MYMENTKFQWDEAWITLYFDISWADCWVSWKKREACITAPFLQFNVPPVLTVHPQRHFLIRAPFLCLTTITVCWSGIRGVLKRDRYEETFRGCLVQTMVWQGQLHLYIEIFFLFGVLEGSSAFSGRFSLLCLFFSSFVHWANGRNGKGGEKPGIWISRQVGIPWCRSVRCMFLLAPAVFFPLTLLVCCGLKPPHDSRTI